MSQERFDKMMALALNKGATNEEAVAAFVKARKLALNGAQAQSTPVGDVVEDRMLVPLYWVDALICNLSQQAFAIGLLFMVTTENDNRGRIVNVRCHGSRESCNTFRQHLAGVQETIRRQAVSTRTRTFFADLKEACAPAPPPKKKRWAVRLGWLSFFLLVVYALIH